MFKNIYHTLEDKNIYHTLEDNLHDNSKELYKR